jgi:hypothetical protein
MTSYTATDVSMRVGRAPQGVSPGSHATVMTLGCQTMLSALLDQFRYRYIYIYLVKAISKIK